MSIKQSFPTGTIIWIDSIQLAEMFLKADQVRKKKFPKKKAIFGPEQPTDFSLHKPKNLEWLGVPVFRCLRAQDLITAKLGISDLIKKGKWFHPEKYMTSFTWFCHYVVLTEWKSTTKMNGSRWGKTTNLCFSTGKVNRTSKKMDSLRAPVPGIQLTCGKRRMFTQLGQRLPWKMSVLSGWCLQFDFKGGVFPECVARVPVSLLGVRLCSPKVAFAFATVGNRSQPFATVGNRPPQWRVLPEGVSKVCPVDSCRRSCIGVCRGGVSVSDLCRRSYFGVCRGDVSVSDLCRRSCIGVWSVASPQLLWRLQGGCQCQWSVSLQFLWTFAEEASLWVICGVAVLLAFAEEASVWVICGVAVIFAFAEEVSVWGTCVLAAISAFAPEVSVRVICGAAVILAFAEEVSVWGIYVAAIILAFAGGVSEWGICVAAVSLASAKEASVRVSYKSVKIVK